MGETRTAVAKLLCKIFLHYLVTLGGQWEWADTWFRILEQVDRMMGSGQGKSGMVSLELHTIPTRPLPYKATRYDRTMGANVSNRKKKSRKASRISFTL